MTIFFKSIELLTSFYHAQDATLDGLVETKQCHSLPGDHDKTVEYQSEVLPLTNFL
jgi:hypothetical protein